MQSHNRTLEQRLENQAATAEAHADKIEREVKRLKDVSAFQSNERAVMEEALNEAHRVISGLQVQSLSFHLPFSYNLFYSTVSSLITSYHLFSSLITSSLLL